MIDLRQSTDPWEPRVSSPDSAFKAGRNGLANGQAVRLPRQIWRIGCGWRPHGDFEHCSDCQAGAFFTNAPLVSHSSLFYSQEATMEAPFFLVTQKEWLKSSNSITSAYDFPFVGSPFVIRRADNVLALHVAVGLQEGNGTKAPCCRASFLAE